MTEAGTGGRGRAETGEPTDGDAGAGRFLPTLIKVMSMQVVALLVLWLLQARYAG